MACTIEIVDDVNAAIEHIHQHGRHASCNHLDFFISFVSVCTHFLGESINE